MFFRVFSACNLNKLDIGYENERPTNCLPEKTADEALNCLMHETYFVFGLSLANLVRALTPTVDDMRITWHKTIISIIYEQQQKLYFNSARVQKGRFSTKSKSLRTKSNWWPLIFNSGKQWNRCWVKSVSDCFINEEIFECDTISHWIDNSWALSGTTTHKWHLMSSPVRTVTHVRASTIQFEMRSVFVPTETSNDCQFLFLLEVSWKNSKINSKILWISRETDDFQVRWSETPNTALLSLSMTSDYLSP